ncbi:MAG: hypothetical protein OEM64_01160, partial [Gammaproteobacteria bacterium]|nr:hypothetical protein [Gammaproteobacteria bacterium]
IGETVMIVNEPYLLGWRDGEMYFEGHAPLEDDTISPADRLESLLQDQENKAGAPLRQADKDQLRAIASVANGVPVRVGLHDMDEVLARAVLVHNTVEIDPDAPTLLEVREMMDEVTREVEEESESL